MHWEVPRAMLEPHVPAGLELDTYDGSAWLGVVPFLMEDVHPRRLPPLPGAANFPELNLRTYVRGAGRAGVMFFSLEAASRIAVTAARMGFNLPYMNARMRVDTNGELTRYVSQRTHRGEPHAGFRASYHAVGAPYLPQAGTRDHWFTERYALFGRTKGGQTYVVDIHHDPWVLRSGDVTIEENSIAIASGLELPIRDPLVHCAGNQDVLAWWRHNI